MVQIDRNPDGAVRPLADSFSEATAMAIMAIEEKAMNKRNNAAPKQPVSMADLAKGLSIGLTRPECTDTGSGSGGVGGGVGGGGLT